MIGTSASGFQPEYLKNGKCDPIKHHKKGLTLQYDAAPIPAEDCEMQDEELWPACTRSAIAFLQQEHATVLAGLHDEVAQLQARCSNLQFALTMQIPYVSPEDQRLRVDLEKALADKERDCIDFRDRLLLSERNERRLRADLYEKEQIEAQLRSELAAREEAEQHLRRELERALALAQPTTSRREPSFYERANSISSVAELRAHTVPIPPPKSSRGRAFVRPSSLYRRLLGFGSRALSQDNVDDNEAGSQQPAPSRNLRSQDGPSSIPQLPRLVNRASASTSAPRPLVRQQLRVNKLSSGSSESSCCGTLAIDQVSVAEQHRTQPSEHTRHNL